MKSGLWEYLAVIATVFLLLGALNWLLGPNEHHECLTLLACGIIP